MDKKEFLSELEKRLQGLPKADIEERLEFYSESIDDRVEEGKTEEEAINDMGGIDSVVNQIVDETPIVNLVKERVKPKRRLTGLEIALLIIGFPLWFPFLLVFLVLTLVFYLLVWVLVIVTYSIEIGFVGMTIFAFGAALFEFAGHNIHVGYIGLGLLGLGASMLFIFVCIASTKLSIKFTKKIFSGIKRKLIGGKN